MEKHLSAFLIIYFGELPSYFDFWAKSCDPYHKQFHWFVYSDQINQKIEVNKAVTLVPYGFERLCSDLKKFLDINIPNKNTRIICDCRLMLYPLREKKRGFR